MLYWKEKKKLRLFRGKIIKADSFFRIQLIRVKSLASLSLRFGPQFAIFSSSLSASLLLFPPQGLSLRLAPSHISQPHPLRDKIQRMYNPKEATECANYAAFKT
uniref:Uncharacterized protein n=1 Tax=Candidozyma auris TaxID=498019 RepID=A0A0L0P0R1_CANAR